MQIHKTTLGAEFTMNWIHFENTEEAINKLKKKITIFAIEQVEREHFSAGFKIAKRKENLPLYWEMK